MMPFRLLPLVLLCALASACVSTGHRAAQPSTPDTGIVAAAVPPSEDAIATAPAGDVDVSVPAAPAAADPAKAQDLATRATAGDAEADFSAIYGQPGDGSNPATGALPTAAAFDPWETYNRRVHGFNMAFDRGLAKPLARAYVAAVPRPVRAGVNNFFDNLGQPVTVVNSLLQANPRGAGNALGRFLLNSTVGIGGLFDVASRARIPRHGEDFGQTLAVWGWQQSRYLELPLLGPRTVRDVVGLAGDARLRPVRYVQDDTTRAVLQGLQLVNLRAKLLPIEGLMNQGAVDEYQLFRDMWLQRRRYQIGQTGESPAPAAGETLPPYLMPEAANVPDGSAPVRDGE